MTAMSPMERVRAYAEMDRRLRDLGVDVCGDCSTPLQGTGWYGGDTPLCTGCADPTPCDKCGTTVPDRDRVRTPAGDLVCEDCRHGTAIDEYDDHKDRELGL